MKIYRLIHAQWSAAPSSEKFTSIAEPLPDEDSGFGVVKWIICAAVVVVIILIVVIATGVVWHRKRRQAARRIPGDNQSENPSTVVTTVLDQDQYSMGKYPFSNPPDLPSTIGVVPNPRPDLLEGATAPVHQYKGVEGHK